MDPIQVSFKDVLKKILNFFEEQKVEYVLFGAWAVNFWGQPRATEDFDFLVLLSEKDFQHLKEKVQNKTSFRLDTEWARHNPMIAKFHVRFGCHNILVDMTLPRTQHDETVLNRRIKKAIGDITLYIPTPEDVIIQKLRAGRGKDFDDALSIFIKQKKNIDLDYIRSWARRLGIYEELNWLFTKVE